MKKITVIAGMCLALLGEAKAQNDFYHMRVRQDSCALEHVKPSTCAALKTNAIYDFIVVPNIGVEYYIGKGYSIGATYWYTWWKDGNSYNSQDDFWRSYGVEVNARKYLDRTSDKFPFKGHHVGILAQGYMYDTRHHFGKGRMSDFSFCVGLEYGYSVPVTRKLNLDFSIGLGYAGGKYKTYDQRDGHYVWERTSFRNFVGPVKAEASIVYLIGKNNINKGKEE